MLSEEEIRDRARYCTCVFLQLSWLYSNEDIEPSRYLEVLGKSSLDLGGDGFITETLEEGLLLGKPDAGLSSIITLYEGFVHALCEVLEVDMEEIRGELAPEFLEGLAAEVGFVKE